MKASFQPRLPKYKPGDIALTLGFTYTYHEGTRPVTDVVHRKYYKHWTNKLFKNSPPEGGPDWFYVNQLELLIRGNNIWEAEYMRTYYIKHEMLNDFGRYQTRYSTHN